MAIITPLKFKMSGSSNLGPAEMEPGDLMPANLIEGLPGRNKFINGSLYFWQRNIAFNFAGTGAGYASDRWLFNYTGATIVINRLSLNPGEIDQLVFCMRVAISGYTGGVSGVNMRQCIELVQTLSGKEAVVSFIARGSVAGMTMSVRGQQVYGTGGSSASGLGGGGIVTLTTGWQRYAVKVSVPSIAGKTAGANNNLQVIIDFNGNGNYDIAGLQIDEGVNLNPLEYPFYGDELLRVQRFYEKSYDPSVVPGTASAFGRLGEFLGVSTRTTGNAFLVPFKVMKRTTPAMSVYASESGVLNQISQDNGTGVAVSGIAAVGHNGFQVSWTNGSGRYGGSFHFVADAEF